MRVTEALDQALDGVPFRSLERILQREMRRDRLGKGEPEPRPIRDLPDEPALVVGGRSFEEAGDGKDHVSPVYRKYRSG